MLKYINNGEKNKIKDNVENQISTVNVAQNKSDLFADIYLWVNYSHVPHNNVSVNYEPHI